MKITVNKAKIKKLASFAKSRNNYPYQKIYFQTGRAIVTNGNTVLAIDYKTEPGEVVEPYEVDAAALLELIGSGKEKEILIDLEKMNYNPVFPTFQDLFKEMETAGTVAKIPRMFWALLEPKGAGEFCNLLLTGEQLKAELYKEDEYNKGKYIFCAGCEIEQKNDLAAPLLLYLPDKRIYKPAGKKTEFNLVYTEKRNQYYWKYESEMGTVYTHTIEKGGLLAVKKHYFSDEILTAYQSAIDEMNPKSEPTTEPEPTNIEPKHDKEKEQMQPKNEIEPTEPTMEQTTEQPETTGWTGRADFHERRDARRERREARIEKLEAIAAAPVKTITDDIAYWTQPAQNNAAGRAFARQREKEANRYFNAIQNRVEAGEKAARLSNIRESTAISSDDPEALDKLRAKLQALKENHEKLKAENKRRRQAGEEPFPWYTLQYSNRDIKRIEERIKELETRQNTTWKKYKFDGGEIIPNVEENRYQIFHDEKPGQDIIDALKAAGWRWSKYYRCWQRMLNRATVSAIETSGKWGRIDYLPGLHAVEESEQEPEEPAPEPEQEQEPEPAAMQEGAEVVEPVEESQPEQTQPIEKEEQEKMQDEKTNEPEPTEAGVLPMTDKLKLWGLPLDWERVQVIKHNAQESGLALMVYNTEGDGALFAMLPGFWAIVKERSKFDENSERFIRDNYDGVICYFDKDPEQAEMQEEPKAANPPIYTESVKWMEDAKTVSIPAPVVACKVDAPVQIPEPEPKPTTEEPDPEQIDKTKPTGAELRYSLSLLAMPYPIDTLIEKFLKKTNKPVRYSIVEKLLMTIDRGSVPKPGESKMEYIKTYYQTH